MWQDRAFLGWVEEVALGSWSFPESMSFMVVRGMLVEVIPHQGHAEDTEVTQWYMQHLAPGPAWRAGGWLWIGSKERRSTSDCEGREHGERCQGESQRDLAAIL